MDEAQVLLKVRKTFMLSGIFEKEKEREEYKSFVHASRARRSDHNYQPFPRLTHRPWVLRVRLAVPSDLVSRPQLGPVHRSLRFFIIDCESYGALRVAIRV